MKKLILIVAIVSLSSFDTTDEKNLELGTYCSDYADGIAADNPNNYWAAWFYAYDYCINIIGPTDPRASE